MRLDTLLAFHWPLKITMVLKATFFLHHQLCLTHASSYSPFLLIYALSRYFHHCPLGSVQFVFVLKLCWQNKLHLLAGNSPVLNTVTVWFPVHFTLIPPS